MRIRLFSRLQGSETSPLGTLLALFLTGKESCSDGPMQILLFGNSAIRWRCTHLPEVRGGPREAQEREAQQGERQEKTACSRIREGQERKGGLGDGIRWLTEKLLLQSGLLDDLHPKPGISRTP